MKLMCWLKDLNRLVRWFREDFGKVRAVLIYKNGDRRVIDMIASVPVVLKFACATVGVIENIDQLPTEIPQMKELHLVAQSFKDLLTVCVYEER